MRKRLFRMAVIVATVLTMVFGNTIQAIACTQIYLGSETTADGSILWGRSEDISQSYGKVYTVHPAEDHDPGEEFVSSQGFTMPYPAHTFRYTLIKDQYSNDRITPEPYGEAGINENGVAVSSSVTLSGGKTEIVGPRNAPGGVDRMVSTSSGGIEEAEVTSVVLMQATSARHGVEVLADIYDTYGAATRDGTQIGDANEVWFMHALSGHQYVAVRMPADKIGFSPNMTLLGEVDVTDTDNVIASPDLIATALAAGTFVAGPNDDPFSPDAVDGHTTINVTRSYATDPSVSGRLYLGYYYLKGVDAAKALNADELDYFIEPRADGKYDLYEAMRFLAYHGNAEDAEDGRYVAPVAGNGSAIGNYGTVESHIFQTRVGLPAQIATIEWLAQGPAEFSIYVPGYQALVTETDEHYSVELDIKTTNTDADETKDFAAYWVFRQIYTLTNTNRAALEPLVAPVIEQYQKSLIEQQAAIDEAMVALYAADPAKAEKLATDLNKEQGLQAYEFALSLLGDLRTIQAAGFPSDATLSEATLDAAVPDYSLPDEPLLTVLFTAAQDDRAVGTVIDLSFSSVVSGLTAAGITVTDGTGTALTGGVLTGSGTDWQLALGSVPFEGNLTVRVADWFIYAVGTEAQTVAVRHTAAAALTDTVAEAEAVEHGGKYQTEKWQAVQDALAVAEPILADPNADPEAVRAAQATLDEALAALKYTDATFTFAGGDEYVPSAGADLVCVLARDLSLHNGTVKLDGRTLTEGVDYRVEEGSTKLTVFAGALSGLGAGDHTLAVGFSNGDVEAPFTTLGAGGGGSTVLPATGDTAPGLIALSAVLVLLAAAALLTRTHTGIRTRATVRACVHRR